MFKKYVALLLIIIVALTLMACNGKSTNTTSPSTSSSLLTANETSIPSSSTSPEVSTSPSPSNVPVSDSVSLTKTNYPITLKDATGTNVTFTGAPQKVITLVPSETEIIYAIGAGNTVIGVDTYSDYPIEAKSKIKVGDAFSFNEEVTIGLNPDLVIASSTMTKVQVDQLRSRGIKVWATDPKTYDQVVDKIQTIGVIFDKQKQANEIAAHMKDVKQKALANTSAIAKKKVFYELDLGYTVGSGEFIDEMITLAGGINVVTTPGWPTVNEEQVAAAKPEIILLPTKSEYIDPENIKAAISKRAWSEIPAVKNNKFFNIDDSRLTRVGPRLADALIELEFAIHSELLKLYD